MTERRKHEENGANKNQKDEEGRGTRKRSEPLFGRRLKNLVPSSIP